MNNLAKNISLQLGALSTLALSITSFLILVFSIINILIPDTADSSWYQESTEDSLRYAIASLVVFLPAYLYLTRAVNKARRQESQLYTTLTKWLIYLALLVAGLCVLVDAVVLLLGFLNGELTTRFLLKAIVFGVVIGGAFEYYRRDVNGYWNTREYASLLIGGLVALVSFALMVYGFLLLPSPSEVRAERQDEATREAMRDIQWRIEEYARETGSVPAELTDITWYGYEVPSEVTYNLIDNTSYELCADFNTEYAEEATTNPYPRTEKGYNPQNYTWSHSAGRHCFKRTVDLSENV